MEKSREISIASKNTGELQIIEGELVDTETGGAVEQLPDEKASVATSGKRLKSAAEDRKAKTKAQTLYVFLPLIFLSVALLGGLRFSAPDNAFLFLKPALICLIYAAFLLLIFFRAGLLRLDGWFSENFASLKNIANAGVLLSLFAATTQIFNSLIPEQGLPFWVIAFCFFWTLSTNLFAEFDTKKLLKSLGALFGVAFITKYLVLSYLTAPVSESFWRGLLENPTQEFFTWLFDLPRFAPATGYVQFFAVVFYLLGLFLLPRETFVNEK